VLTARRLKGRVASDKGDVTLLTYEVDAQIGGKLARLGQRLIAGSVKKIADDLFEKFAQLISNG
jgi:carbon monoxide dehydrogenase subunit G